MTTSPFRPWLPAALSALALGILAAGCGVTREACGPRTCDGCCDEDGCVDGTAASACGQDGLR